MKFIPKCDGYPNRARQWNGNLRSYRRQYIFNTIISRTVTSKVVFFIFFFLLLLLWSNISPIIVIVGSGSYNSTSSSTLSPHVLVHARMVNKERVTDSSTTTTTISTTSVQNRISSVPFFYYAPSLPKEEIPPDETTTPPFHLLRRSMDGYRADVFKLLHQLERAVLLSEESERYLTTSTSTFSMTQKLREKRSTLASILELDSFTLETLLQPFPVTIALTDSSCDSDTDSSYSSVLEDPSKEESTGWVLKTPKRLDVTNQHSSELSYSSITSVLAHLTRDWTDLGFPIRQSYYTWLLRELLLSHSSDNDSPTNPRRVLVPGAGLARLAQEIAHLGYSVEANDCSIVMAAVAYRMLHHHHHHDSKHHSEEVFHNATTAQPKSTGFTIHPFATDPFTNEVTASLRFQEVEIRRTNEPLVFQMLDTTSDPTSNYQLLDTKRHGSLSYTVGDFVSIYSSPRRRGYFDSIVTCFFLDTATNIYEYIATIRHALKPQGGVWINLGPVQWHEHARIQPSVDELRQLIQDTFHFHISHWQVDLRPIHYRNIHEKDTLDHPLSSATSTRFEGYRPLRFVATTSIPVGDQGNENLSDRIDSLRRSFDHMRYTN